MSEEHVLFFEDFGGCEGDSPLPADWWVEGGEKTWIEGGHLRVKANPEGTQQPGCVCTVWNRKIFRGDVRVEFDAHILNSTIDADNVNFFLLYSDPSERSLYKSRGTRAGGEYQLYHNLNGYIFTFLNDRDAGGGRYEDGSTKARFRVRRCPGFRIVTETYGYHCRKGITYHMTITKRGGCLTFAVDDTVYLEGHDDRPWTEGLIGLRTFQTDLWWDNIKVTELPPS